MSVMSDCLRGFLIPAKGRVFIGADFSAIEARVLAWLAGEEKILEIFRTHGKIYEAAAADIYRVPINEVTKEQRQIGKVAVLALGYQGGAKAFQAMGRGYGVKISEEKSDSIKNAWRAANPRIVRYWYALEEAAREAIEAPGSTTVVRASRFRMKGSFLFCQLPSKRILTYPYPKVEEIQTPWGEPKQGITFMGVTSMSNKWERQKTYGGSLAENITQAVARDILAEALVRLEARGYPIVMHVHDEALCEVPENKGSVEEMEAIMSEVPVWAAGLPIAAEGWSGRRYRK
jgi:DNA polymerase